jgi:hypothetical protein
MRTTILREYCETCDARLHPDTDDAEFIDGRYTNVVLKYPDGEGVCESCELGFCKAHGSPIPNVCSNCMSNEIASIEITASQHG